MRVILIALLLPATLTLASAIPSDLIRSLKGNTVIHPISETDATIDHAEVAKRNPGAGECRSVKIKEGICPREANPQGTVTLDPTHVPTKDCFRDLICCGNGCNGLDIVGPAGSPKRDGIPEELESTVMEKPNMKPLVKRQDPLPQAGQQVIIYQDGQLKDQKYAGLFTCKLPGAAPPPPPPTNPPPPPAPSPVAESLFHIGYFRQNFLGSGDKFPPGFNSAQYKAAVFANNIPTLDERDVCPTTPTYRDAEFTFGERPKYPQKIRFDSAGRKGCEFNRLGDDDEGGMNCHGVLAKCKKVDGDPDVINCKDDKEKKTDAWRTQWEYQPTWLLRKAYKVPKLVEFLHHGNTQIRQIATENLIPYSKTQPAIFKTGQLTPIKDLKLLVKDYAPIACSALTILINISDDPEILTSLAEDDVFVESIFSRITNPKESNATSFAMLLPNLAKSDSFARLLNIKRPTVRTLSSTATNAFDQLLDLFNKGVGGSYNPDSKLEYLPYLFADLAKFSTISTHLLSSPDPSIPPLLTTFTPHTSPPTLPLPLRLGSTSTIRNALLSVSSPLTTIPTLIPHIVPPLLLPLIGTDPAFSDSESDSLPPELQLLGPEHRQENNLQVLNNIVEALFLICARGGEEARKAVRGMGAYAVVREVHVGVEDEGIREGVERVVQLLMGDEVGEWGDDEMEAGKQEGRMVGEQGAKRGDDEDEDEKIVEIF
ncbi:MAG: hypothetical protein Q9169_004333 [Polycauliona sp. 2 TL-2023]